MQQHRKTSRKWLLKSLIKQHFKTLVIYRRYIDYLFTDINASLSTHLSILFLAQIVASCAPQMTTISRRNPDLIEKEKDPIERSDTSISTVSPELYIKENRIIIQPYQDESSNGSLANPDDDRLNLFGDVRPRKIGRHLTVVVDSNNANRSNASSEQKDDNGAKSDATNGDDKKVDPLEEEILKSLPDLTPAQKESVKLLKQFKMQITHRYPNGDLMARIARSSNNPDSTESFVAQAKIPSERLASGDPITTEDLVDVIVTENHGGEVVERRSTSWEDEYSLRLSGFTEAKSRAGLDLEEKRKELGEARDRLEQRIKDFATEKRQFAAQRDQFRKAISGTSDLPNAQSGDQSPRGTSASQGSNDQGTQPSSPTNADSELGGNSSQTQAPKGGSNG